MESLVYKVDELQEEVIPGNNIDYDKISSHDSP
jgi:hypothetical protein